MSANTIDRALIIQFSDMLHVKSQQIKARLRPYTRIKPMSGDVFAYDGLGQVEAREVTGRYQPVVFADLEHLRRKITRRRFEVTLPIDDMDVRAVLINPEGEYAEAVMRAMERVYDRVVIQAMFADVKTGRDFETTVSFATDGGNTVSATGGLTYEKLLELKAFFTNHEVGNDTPEKLIMGITGDEETSLMKETELISGDFTRQFAVEKGSLVNACGIDIVKYGASTNAPMLSVASTTRSCFVMSERAMVVGMSKEFGVKIQPRTDLVDTTQVQVSGILGAVRTEGVLIQKLTTTVA